MGPTWGPSGADRTQVGPILATRTLLSGITIACYSVIHFHSASPSVPSTTLPLAGLIVWFIVLWPLSCWIHLGKHKYIFALPIILNTAMPQVAEITLMEATDLFTVHINTMAADVLTAQGARSSTASILVKFDYPKKVRPGIVFPHY